MFIDPEPDADYCDLCGYYGHSNYDCPGFSADWDEDDEEYDPLDEFELAEDAHLDSYWEDRLLTLYE